MTDALNFITVDDLAIEIQKHHDSDLLRSLLAELREKRVDLKEFCKRVRMLIGAPVLVATVKGLQVAQSLKKAEQWEQQLASPVVGGGAEQPGNGTVTSAAPPAAPPASAPPQPSGAAHQPSLAPLEVKAEDVSSCCAALSPASSSTPTPPASAAASAGAYGGAALARDAGGTKLLIHALLCNRPETCTMADCATMKGFLVRVEAHTKTCNYSNQPGGLLDCVSCAKWQQMLMLREHYRRKLIAHAKATPRQP